MKLLLRLGNGQTKVIDNVISAEEFADYHRVFTSNEKEHTMDCPGATFKHRYWLIHSSDLKKPLRAVGFEVIK